MTKRSECTCPCHTDFGCQMIHIAPCCEPDEQRSITDLTDEFRSIVALAIKMLERDDTPARKEVAQDLRTSSGVIIEKLKAI